MPDAQCKQCRFWQKNRRNEGDRGECRRHAPLAVNQIALWHGEILVVIADLLSRHFSLQWTEGIEPEPTETTASATFPRTYPEFWCGEFEANA